jgi:hypothetical protein
LGENGGSLWKRARATHLVQLVVIARKKRLPRVEVVADVMCGRAAHVTGEVRHVRVGRSLPI